MRVFLCALAVLAIVAPATVHAASPLKPMTEAQKSEMWSIYHLATCIAQGQSEKARALLLTDAGSSEEKVLIDHIIGAADACSPAGSYDVALLRGALAEVFYKKDFAALPAPPPSFEQPDGRNAFADCVVARSQTAVDRLLRTEIDSDGEDAAANALLPAMSVCLPETGTRQLNLLTLRTGLAEAHYARARAAGGKPDGARLAGVLAKLDTSATGSGGKNAEAAPPPWTLAPEALVPLRNVTDCMAEESRSSAARVFRTFPLTEESADRLMRAKQHRCASAGGVGSIPQHVLRGVLAQRLLHEDFGAIGSPAKHKPAELFAWPAAGELQALSPSTRWGLSMLYIGECVAKAEPAKVNALLATPLMSEAEAAQLGDLRPAIGACVPAGQTLNIRLAEMRAFLAEGAYRAAASTGER